MAYNWQQKDWPNFKYDLEALEELLVQYNRNLGRIEGSNNALTQEEQVESLIELMVLEAIKTNEIEGENLNRKDVASSIRKNLGLLKHTETIKDARANGSAELLISVRRSFFEPLSEEMLFDWHNKLMHHNNHIQKGMWRQHSEPMQIVSGALGKEKIHFEAPPSEKIPQEMNRFIDWFNSSSPTGKSPIQQAAIRSAVAHLYFESIHPFEDGNGRIGRAIAEKALAQTNSAPQLISLSATIEQNKKAYYENLELAQRGNNINKWVQYFVEMVLESQQYSQKVISFTLQKSRFFSTYQDQFNEDQLKVIKRMFNAGVEGFEGGMTAEKYMRITKVSKATATRHLQQLLSMKALKQEGQGRSTRYYLDF